jgi:hypothetical protein
VERLCNILHAVPYYGNLEQYNERAPKWARSINLTIPMEFQFLAELHEGKCSQLNDEQFGV